LVLLLSFLSALLVPVLIIDLGLIVRLLVGRGVADPPVDWVLGTLLAVLPWPLFGQFESSLLALVGFGIAVAIVESITVWLLARFVHKLAIRVTARLREAIHSQAFRFGTHDLLGTARSSPEELFSTQAEQVRSGLVVWYQAAPSSWDALVLLVLLAAAVNFWLALFAVIMSIYIARMYRRLKRRSEYNGQRWNELAGRREVKLLRTLSLAPMTTGYGLDEPPGEPFHEALSEFELAELRSRTSIVATGPILLMTILLASGFLLLVVGLRPDLTVSGTVILGAALICVYFPAYRLFRLRKPLDAADAAAILIFAYLDRDPSVSQVEDARPVDRLQRELKLDRITLADRNGYRLLDQVSMTIPAGNRIAVLASDPQTPLALAGLFVRFYDPAAGRILYDDHDIRHATLDTIRGQALLVASRGPLFPGTVTDNIACGNLGFTTLQIADAARQARAYDFVQALPQGFSTRIGDHPPLLTSDQAFRIGLARALLREPSLLVVEEPTGPLDEATLRELEAAILEASKGRTVVSLPSIPATLRSADDVFVFHEGQLDAQGKHADLLQNSELYRHLNYIRFNAFRQKIKR
jgi:ABC-type multidrug transport system fused ATPase/permease subunit